MDIGIEVDLICIIILGIILFTQMRKVDDQRLNVLFRTVIVLAIITTSFDLIWTLISTNVIWAPIATRKIINIFYFLFLTLSCYYWFLYVMAFQKSKIFKNKLLYSCTLIPLIIVCLLSILSYNNNIIFYINNNGLYQRGNYYFLQPALTYIYVFYPTITSLLKAFKDENYANKSKYLSMSIFGIVPIIASLFQIHFQDVPLILIGGTIAVLQVFINNQEEQISIDSLTGLNNRHQLMNYLHTKMKNHKKNLYLVVIDIDYFKSINDLYGHIEGDHALTVIADAIRKISNKYKAFSARYGGDEFILVIDEEEEFKIKTLEKELNDLLQEEKQKLKLDYTLSASVGYCKYNNSITNISKFIVKADKNMYNSKQAKRIE